MWLTHLEFDLVAMPEPLHDAFPILNFHKPVKSNPQRQQVPKGEMCVQGGYRQDLCILQHGQVQALDGRLPEAPEISALFTYWFQPSSKTTHIFGTFANVCNVLHATPGRLPAV